MTTATDSPTTPDVDVTNNEAAHRYEAHVDGELAGLITYRADDERVVLTHAEVYPRWEGRGVGSRMAREALDDVVERGKRIVPACGFVAAFVEQNPSYQPHLGTDTG